MDVTEGLPVQRIGLVETRRETRWLIESLWLDQAAGLIGGQPKTCKSWLGLDAAVSIASGTPCLKRFPVTTRGPTLVFLAEDQVTEVRARVDGICQSRGLDIEALDLHVITAPVLRLDDPIDRGRLWHTVEKIAPKLVLLDPLVRMHSSDENNSKDIASILGFLREIQRRFATAVVLTHHASKRSHSRPGQALRGSSDLHAFVDSALYMARDGDELSLTVEHRSAAAIAPIRLVLNTESDVHLSLGSEEPTMAAAVAAPPPPPLEEQIIERLAVRRQVIPRALLRNELRVNNQRFCQALTALIANGRVIATPAGIGLA